MRRTKTHRESRNDTTRPSPSPQRRCSSNYSPNLSFEHGHGHHKRSRTSTKATAVDERSAPSGRSPYRKSLLPSPCVPCSSTSGSRGHFESDSGEDSRNSKKKKTEHKKRSSKKHRKDEGRKHKRRRVSPERARGHTSKRDGDERCKSDDSEQVEEIKTHHNGSDYRSIRSNEECNCEGVYTAPTPISIAHPTPEQYSPANESEEPKTILEPLSEPCRVENTDEDSERKADGSILIDEDAPTPPASPKHAQHAPEAVSTGLERIELAAFPRPKDVPLKDAPTPPSSPAAIASKDALNHTNNGKQGEQGSSVPATSKHSFFAQLYEKELKKGKIGTVHASARGSCGADDSSSRNETVKSSDWECQKCGKINYKNASACDRCRALKRMTLWRD